MIVGCGYVVLGRYQRPKRPEEMPFSSTFRLNRVYPSPKSLVLTSCRSRNPSSSGPVACLQKGRNWVRTSYIQVRNPNRADTFGYYR